MTEVSALLLLPHLRVQHANAIPGPLSWGFPAPSAFLGFTHALERRLRQDAEVRFGGCAIVCHWFEPQVARIAGGSHQLFSLTRNPYHAGWKRATPDDKPAALVEEGRAHFEGSLLIEVLSVLHEQERRCLLRRLPEVLGGMRLAGGSLLPPTGSAVQQQPQWWSAADAEGDSLKEFRRLTRRLLPGFALVERTDLLAARRSELQGENPGVNALDVLLDLCRLTIDPLGPDPQNPARTEWQPRSRAGWLVPIPLGYAALSPLHAPGTVRNARDMDTPFRFCETMYGLGQWISLHRVLHPEQILWRRLTEESAGIYRCVNRYADQASTAGRG